MASGPTTTSRTCCLPGADRRLGSLTGTALFPFPPLPAVMLLPFVAVCGLDTRRGRGRGPGRLNVGLCWRMLQRVTPRRDAAFLGTVFYGFGTVAWYAAMLGSTWFLAHVVASTFLFLGITAALDGERREGLDGRGRSLPAACRARAARRGAVRHGGLARLTTIFGAPFFVFVGPAWTWPGGRSRRASAPHPAPAPGGLQRGDHRARLPPRLRLPPARVPARRGALNDHWNIEDPRYIPQNASSCCRAPERRSSTTPCADHRPAGPGHPVRLGLPAPARQAGHEPAAHQPRLPARAPGAVRGWRRRIVAGAALAVLPSPSRTSATSRRAGSSSATGSATTSRPSP